MSNELTASDLRALAEQGDAPEHQLDKQRGHQRAFGIVQELSVAQRPRPVGGWPEPAAAE